MKPIGTVIEAQVLAGSDPKTTSALLVPSSRPVSPKQKLSRKALKAAKAADQLFDLLPPLDVGDPKAFIAGTAAILAEYPNVVIDAAVDPVRGIPSRTDRPTLKLIKAVCEELYEPILRRLERKEVARKSFRALPRPPRSAEEQKRVDKQVADARAMLGIKDGASRRAAVLPPSADAPYRSGLPGQLGGDGKHALRVAADLEIRRAHADATKEASNITKNESDDKNI